MKSHSVDDEKLWKLIRSTFILLCLVVVNLNINPFHYFLLWNLAFFDEKGLHTHHLTGVQNADSANIQVPAWSPWVEWPNPRTGPEPTEDPTKEKRKEKLKGCCLDILTPGTQAVVERILISFSCWADVDTRYSIPSMLVGQGGGEGRGLYSVYDYWACTPVSRICVLLVSNLRSAEKWYETIVVSVRCICFWYNCATAFRRLVCVLMTQSLFCNNCLSPY